MFLAFLAFAITSIHVPYRDGVSRHLYETAGRAVYMLKGANRHGATGFVMRTPKGRPVLITNLHVCHLAIEGELQAMHEKTTGPLFFVQVVLRSDESDLCALTAPMDARPLTLAPNAGADEPLYEVGHPELAPLAVTRGFILGPIHDEWARGDLSVIECQGKRFQYIPEVGCLEQNDSLSTSIETWPGNSGSPVLTSAGAVVGVMFATDMSNHQGSMIPRRDLVRFLTKVDRL